MTVKIVAMKDGRKKVKIIQSYRRIEDKRPTTAVVRDLGFLDELEKEHADALGWAKSEARRLTEEAEARRTTIPVSLDLSERLEDGAGLRKNIGYAALSRIYHELELDCFWNDRRRYRRFGFNANSVFKALVYNRILCPSSKKGAWEGREMFFEDSGYTLDAVYSAMDFFQQHEQALVERLDEGVRRLHGRDTFLLHYDVTNYYFEIDDDDGDAVDESGNVVRRGLRKKGCSKEHRTTPIVQMGLFMDRNGLPVTYDLFPGNTHDSQTLIPMIERASEHFRDSNLIVVADKGMMSGDNIRMIHAKRQGYIISTSVRKADAKFREYVLDRNGYSEFYDPQTGELEFMIKGRLTPRRIWVTDPAGRKVQASINERQVVIWSRDYGERERHQRGKVLEKTRRLIGTGSEDAMAVKFGARKYIVKRPMKAGQPADIDKYELSLDEELVDDEEALDGYYAICTNVVGLTGDPDIDRRARDYFDSHPGAEVFFDSRDGFFVMKGEASDQWILDTYHGLWRIEETFKVTKSGLETRPVFVWTENRIRAHFLICFTALTILRLLQFRMGWRHSDAKIRDALLNASGTFIGQNVYAFDYSSPVLREIGDLLGIDFSRRYMTLGDIKKLLAAVKKVY